MNNSQEIVITPPKWAGYVFGGISLLFAILLVLGLVAISTDRTSSLANAPILYTLFIAGGVGLAIYLTYFGGKLFLLYSFNVYRITDTSVAGRSTSGRQVSVAIADIVSIEDMPDRTISPLVVKYHHNNKIAQLVIPPNSDGFYEKLLPSIWSISGYRARLNSHAHNRFEKQFGSTPLDN